MPAPKATFVIDFDVNTGGLDKGSSALESFRAMIEKDTSALKEMANAMANLKGTAEVIRWEGLPRDIAKADNEVAKFAAKMAKLKADIDAAPAGKKESLIAKSVGTQEELTKATAQLAAFKAERDKLSRTSPVRVFEDLKTSSNALKQKLGENQAAFSRLGGTMGVVDKKTFFGGIYEGADNATRKVKALIGTEGELRAVGVVLKGVAASLVALTVAGAAAGGFVLWASDAARSARLLREAAAGGSEAAQGLYDATVRVEGKTGAQRDEVVALANEYARLKFSMGAIEGATTAITIASQTMGSQVGSTIKGLVDRGMVARRFWLNPLDLRGTGIAIKDVAVQLGKAMHVGVGTAETALRQGTVKIEDGVKAMGAAFEKSPLGEIARKQSLALGVQFERAKSSIGRLFDDVKIEPFLEKLHDVLDIFNETSETGKALKAAFTAIFQPFIDSATSSLPLVRNMILDGTISVLKMAIAFKEAGGATAVFDSVKASAVSLWDTLKDIADTLKAIGHAYNVIRHPIATAQADQKAAEDAAFMRAFNGTQTAKEATDMGLSLTAGIALGIEQGTGKPVDAIVAMSQKMKAAFDLKNERHSPSALYRRDARDLPRGAALGITDETPTVARALAKMAEPPEFDASNGVLPRSKGGVAERPSVHLVIHYNGGGSRSEARRFGQWLVDELETLTLAKGLPV